MNDKTQVKLSETIVLVDAAFLNLVVADTKGYFEKLLHRSLQKIDVSELAICMTLDAGITEGDNAIQFLFIYDNASNQLFHSSPSDLKNDLDGVAFQSPFGEYSFGAVPTEGMVSRGELFLDLLSVVADSADVKRMIVISSDREYGEKVTEFLNGVKNKQIFQLRMDDPTSPVEYEWDMLAFSVLHALGVASDELQQE